MERRLSNANRWQATVKSRLGNAIRTVMTPVHMRSRTFLNQNVLHLAAGFGHAEAVRALLDAGARADVVDSPAGRTPRALAKAMGHAEVVSVFDAAAAAT